MTCVAYACYITEQAQGDVVINWWHIYCVHFTATMGKAELLLEASLLLLCHKVRQRQQHDVTDTTSIACEPASLSAALGVEPGTFEAALLDFFIALMADPAALNSFFKNECETKVVTGGLAPFFATLQGIEPPASKAITSVTTCRDTDSAAEAYFRCVNHSIIKRTLVGC
jgi:hypothetical protein